MRVGGPLSLGRDARAGRVRDHVLRLALGRRRRRGAAGEELATERRRRVEGRVVLDNRRGHRERARNALVMSVRSHQHAAAVQLAVVSRRLTIARQRRNAARWGDGPVRREPIGVSAQSRVALC